RPSSADTITRAKALARQPGTRPVPGPAYRTDTSGVTTEEMDPDEAVAGNKSPDAGRNPLQRAADAPRRTDRYGNGSTADGNRRAEADAGLDDARVQRLESQVADLNRQLEALRNERRPAGRLSQENSAGAERPGNDGNDRRPVRETRERETHRYVVVPGRHDRNLDRGQAAGELSAITAQLNTLKAGQSQLMADQSSQQKLDSLLTQVTALRSQLDTARAARPPGAGQEGPVALDSTAAGNDGPDRDTLGRSQNPEPAAAAGDTVLHAVQDQLAALRRSVDQLQEQLLAAREAPTPRKRLPYGPLVIYYPVNSVAISPGDRQRLAGVARRLGTDSSVVVQVKGFADQTGNAAYNLSLSRKRAEQIRNYLVTSLGVAPERVIVNYFGQAQATDAKQNPYDRRVELELYSTAE
ncbi:MAG: OmpA family protein, partial [Cytophagales bacterium]|nr:OmpA family protein [Cytophagales bacterium]